jgi:hypothetical protein
VLGPLLFLINISDIDVVAVSRILKFADDTKLYGYCSKQIEEASFDNYGNEEIAGRFDRGFKMFKGIENLDINNFFDLTSAPAGWYSLKLVTHSCRLDSSQFFFTQNW